MEDAGWHKARQSYENFAIQHKNANLLYLELGVGYNTPGIIKYNFWRETHENPNSHYVCLNFGDTSTPPEIKSRSLCLNADIEAVLTSLTRMP